MRDENSAVGVLVLVGLLVVALLWRRPWRGSGTAHGTARWASREDLRRAGMLRGQGLILGRSLPGDQLIRIPSYTHLMMVAPTGAGKGVSGVVPNLLDYSAGSVVVWDPKGENYRLTAARRRAFGQQVVLLDPFGVTGAATACFNPLDLIEPGPRLLDEARALAEAMVVRTGAEPDPHWAESAVAVIQGMLVFVLLRFHANERNLDSVCELVADPAMFATATAGLRQMGGIAARLGNYLGGLRDKELASVLSTANRALACFGSELVAGMLQHSSFDPRQLLQRRPGLTLYFVLPQDQLQAQRGTLRLVIAALLQLVLRQGAASGSEVLFVLDECAALGELDDLEQALILGRGSGIRLFTFWQSVDQARAAFADKPGLLFDNSAAQIYFGAASYETAERISKMLGDATLVVESYATNEGLSYTRGSDWPHWPGQVSSGSNTNYAEIGRPLLRPEEVLGLDPDHLIAFLRGVPPILARRVRWYQEGTGWGKFSWGVRLGWWWLLMLLAVLLVAYGAWGRL